MGLILLEALGAGIVLILIVWWTMFSGRKGGELHEDEDTHEDKAGPSAKLPQTPPSDPPPKA
ncbi:MAG: hypothetical protein EOP81_05255 [Variovorax sp.]|nr:MAG: hypothetical protein EOP81_05255 [Variovorax sp.]